MAKRLEAAFRRLRFGDYEGELVIFFVITLQFFDLKLLHADFTEESCRKRGFLANVLEWLIAIVSRVQIYEDVFVDICGQVFGKGFSLRP